jgi:H+-translocating NAD(P) transhydrogenase subunit alpha
VLKIFSEEKQMKIGIPKEVVKGEARVAFVPASISQVMKKNHEVIIESGAGLGSMFSDDLYEKAGAKIVKSAQDLYAAADIIFKVQPPIVHPATGKNEAEMVREGTAYIGYLAPFSSADAIRILAKRKITSFSMEFIPRITRAQSMDSLSSQATIAGYKAVIIAANTLPRIFPLMMTAAGSISPATVVVLGAGVAGLQAIATAKRLGAKVEAFDPRPVVKEQIENLGATFIPMEIKEDVSTAGGYAKEQSDDFLRREQEAIASRLSKADVVITTAQIFGKKSPILITEEMVKLMPQGSVIVDLASENGGNCALTRPNEVVQKYGVQIHGVVNLPSLIPVNSSQMYTKNLVTLFLHLYADPAKGPDFEDEIVKGACITHSGEIKNEMVKKLLG